MPAPARDGVARLSCVQSFGKSKIRTVAVAGGVRGNDQYALGGIFPVINAQGGPTGWAAALTELPHFQIYTLGYDERPTTERALGRGPWSHTHRFILPAGLLRHRQGRGYSTVSTYVVCAHLESTTSTPTTTPPAGQTTTTASPMGQTTTAASGMGQTTTTTPQLADLRIREVYITDSPVFTWNIVIRNAGDGDASASRTGLTQPDGMERLIDTPAIDAGDSVTITAECPYGSRSQATIRADATDVVDESDEDNNTFDTGVVETGGAGRCKRD